MIGAYDEQLRSCMKFDHDEARLAALNSLLEKNQASMKEAVISLADTGIVPQDLLSDLMSNHELFGYRSRPIKTILITITQLRFGGGPKSASSLANGLSQVKDEKGKPLFKVLLLSDAPLNQGDYKVTPLVQLLSVPPRSPEGSYAERAEVLYELIDREKIDVIIEGTRRDGDTLWDMLLCKSHPSRPAYVQVFRTSFGSLFLSSKDDHLKRRMRAYKQADALVVLSRVDQTIWGLYNSNTFLIPNIIDVSPRNRRSGPKTHHVLWAGRITDQKQPLELVEVARFATQLLSDVCFDIVGEAADQSLAKKMSERIKEYELEDHMFFYGNQTNMDDWYTQADVLCHTAQWEGQGRVLFEAAAYALPTVMYKMPGLDTMHYLPAIVECDQKNAEQMAQDIVCLLTEADLYSATSRQLVDQFSAYSRQDIIGKWRNLFTHLEEGKANLGESINRLDVRKAIDTLTFYHFSHGGSKQDKIPQIKKKLRSILRHLFNKQLKSST